MKIAAVTLNPAIDQTVIVNEFRVGAVNRSLGMRLDAGGKGVNVASFLADYGLDVTVTGFLGEENADLFERHFTKKRITDRFIRVPGETRTNIKVQDGSTHETTDLNTPGQAPGTYAVNRLSEQVQALAEACEWIILSGNLPPGLESNFYAELIQSIKGKKAQIVLDTSGDALRDGLRAGPWLVKPNVNELSELCGRELKTIADAYIAARSFLSDEVKLMVVSMGAQGALFVKQDETLLATPPAVSLTSSVGAGDALVAGLVAGLAKGLELAECARLATAFSLSAITSLERILSSSAKLDGFQKQVTVVPFEIQQSL